MGLRTKALSVAAGAVPLLLGGANPAQAADTVSATETITFPRSRAPVTCTYTGTSQIEHFADLDPPLLISGTTVLVDDHNDPACRDLVHVFVEIAFKRAGSSTFEYVFSGQPNDVEASVAVRTQGEIVDVNVRHGAVYDCDAPRPCTLSFTTNPK